MRGNNKLGLECLLLMLSHSEILYSGILCYSYQFFARTSVTCFFGAYVFHCSRQGCTSADLYMLISPALKLLYFKDLIVNGLYPSNTRKDFTESDGVVNKETYGAIKGANRFV